MSELLNGNGSTSDESNKHLRHQQLHHHHLNHKLNTRLNTKDEDDEEHDSGSGCSGDDDNGIEIEIGGNSNGDCKFNDNMTANTSGLGSSILSPTTNASSSQYDNAAAANAMSPYSIEFMSGGSIPNRSNSSRIVRDLSNESLNTQDLGNFAFFMMLHK